MPVLLSKAGSLYAPSLISKKELLLFSTFNELYHTKPLQTESKMINAKLINFGRLLKIPKSSEKIDISFIYYRSSESSSLTIISLQFFVALKLGPAEERTNSIGYNKYLKIDFYYAITRFYILNT